MVIYNASYNIPRVQVQMPGRQNRLSDHVMRLTPGMTEPLEFILGNQDGVPLNLLGFRMKIIFWTRIDLDDDTLSPGQSEIIFAKKFQIDDPYEGKFTLVLSDEDTLTIGRRSNSTLRWSLFLINEQQDVFPLRVTRSGGRYGNVVLDVESGIPTAELVRSA